VLNKNTLDSDVGLCKACERKLAVKHVDAIKLLNHEGAKDLYICDRGYPSYWLLYYFYNQKVDFLIRCTISSIFGEVKKVFDEGKEDAIVRLHANRLKWEQIQEIKKLIPNFNDKTAYIDLRVVVVTLKTGEKELLVTSLLDQDKYTKDDFMYDYNSRWGVEENYKWHKSAFELENFSGQSLLTIEQEVYAVLFTSNMASILIEEAEEELIEEHKNRPSHKKALKHAYSINRRVGIATIKNKLIQAILDPDTDMDELCQNLKERLKRSICPTRPDRKFERNKKGNAKYGCTTRRCL
jgi:hypothetical protein